MLLTIRRIGRKDSDWFVQRRLLSTVNIEDTYFFLLKSFLAISFFFISYAITYVISTM
jgi:hypothetical protein